MLQPGRTLLPGASAGGRLSWSGVYKPGPAWSSLVPYPWCGVSLPRAVIVPTGLLLYTHMVPMHPSSALRAAGEDEENDSNTGTGSTPTVPLSPSPLPLF